MALFVKQKIARCVVALMATPFFAGAGFAASVESSDLGEPGAPGAPEIEVRGTPREQRLDLLFDELANLEKGADAQATEKTILNLWSQSGSATVDLLMDRAASVVLDGEVELGLGLIDSVVELEPGFSEAWHRRSQLHMVMGNLTEAMVDLQKVLTLEPRHFPAVIALANIFHGMGDREAALSAYRMALEINPHMDEAREAIAELSYQVEGQGI